MTNDLVYFLTNIYIFFLQIVKIILNYFFVRLWHWVCNMIYNINI
jgi:hypothetical protein